ncbi:hypothetical protein [Streptomyces purpureus]|uniref:Glutathionylspermidine synthase pre-ATP-grasp-like domain-containing protein n=1 Tax=Streptomyces purpureus TaxID=1951 RepID=A0A918GY15_9ACTN|nr:hypothetical protein [Streptomyces purpureus]GGT19486.1 hypothetical protein GCM10014713_10650 [Streptomyces purpureus]
MGRILGPASAKELDGYYGGYAPRPVFLSAGEVQQLCRDLEVLRGALFRLPRLLFGGDLAAFARANGMGETQARVIERASAGVPNPPTSMGRADLYSDRSGFRLMEYNMGSTIGFDSGDICRGILENPDFSRFAEEEGLQHVDTLTEQVRTFRHEMGLAPDDRPVIAHVEWPAYIEKNMPYMSTLCKRWRAHGLDAYPCHVGQLERRAGRLWLGDRPVDIVYRQFLIEDLVDDDTEAQLEPLLGALESGEVRMFTSLESELCGSKASLGMLSQRAHRHLFSEEELDVIDRLLPWTSSVTSGRVVLEDGTETSLLEHAMADQHELILKPTLLHGGRGVVPGWSPDLTPEAWRELLVDALDGPYVVQRRIHPVPEPFPEPDGGSQPWIVNWGVVTMASGYGGLFNRVAPVDGGLDVLNLDRGALIGSGFHVGPSPRT